ncbi:hypothetical protein GQ602_002508 [Ophiocordyceps camponoti-floridani]|uniref:Uncharacterized protein n=1 Tax=Ophiocordyceps camponoti-floridani TaxID=2030778 RepID=A0A8H4QAH3_9HYPO|nr:hypothetical protein GQ602_002508 [Ophiocordyceps camponoti-floridani]
MHQLGAGKIANLNTSHHITSQHTHINRHNALNMSIVQTLPREPNEDLSWPRSAANPARLAQLVSKFESLGALSDVGHRASRVDSAPVWADYCSRPKPPSFKKEVPSAALSTTAPSVMARKSVVAERRLFFEGSPRNTPSSAVRSCCLLY